MPETNVIEGRPVADYARFAGAYGRLVSSAAGVWFDGTDRLQQLSGIDRIERQLTAVDGQFAEFVDRAALLGPEFGGTVAMELETGEAPA